MINETIRAVEGYLSGERAYQNAGGIAAFHRIQASQGYRDAAQYCLELLHREGIAAEIEAFPANQKTSFWTQKLFQEWNCKNARLDLVEPIAMTLADYRADPLSIVQRSAACDFTDHPVDIVRMDKGQLLNCDESEAAGKLIFISEDPNRYLEWGARVGVYGFISDYMSDVFVRQRNDRYDDRLFLSFQWMNEKTDHKTFSFLLTPRQGDQLRNLCDQTEQAHQADPSKPRWPKAKGFLDGQFCDGTMENVVATIPGQTKEEVLILAHLCHAKACANDNASGCGGAIEVMKTIHDLVQKGILRKPKRTIRLLLVPEVVGTFAYLASHEDRLEHIKAGIDVDMIGRRQEGECGLVGIMGVPDSTASFVLDLANYVTQESGHTIPTFNLDEYVSPVHTQILSYVGGSDHYVLCDPSVGIPCIIMMQWLDSNYHSSADTLDKLDPNVLHRTCTIAASYLYTLADLDLHDMWYIMNCTRERYTKQLLQVIKDSARNRIGYSAVRERVQYYQDVFWRATSDYRRFFSGVELEQAEQKIRTEQSYLENYADELLAEYLISGKAFADEDGEEYNEDRRYQLVPTRLFRGPITFVGFEAGLDEALKCEYRELKKKYPEFYGINSINDFIVHRVDGKQNLLQIAKSVAIEGKRFSPEYVYEYLAFLERAGLMTLQERS